jgi:hypothetical protein
MKTILQFTHFSFKIIISSVLVHQIESRSKIEIQTHFSWIKSSLDIHVKTSEEKLSNAQHVGNMKEDENYITIHPFQLQNDNIKCICSSDEFIR